MNNGDIIGKVSATMQNPTSADDFTFWLDSGVVIAPFDLVAAQNESGSTTVGVIREIFHTTDSPNHIANYVASDFGNVTQEPATKRIGTIYASVDVMNNDKEIYMPLRDGTPVRFATEDEIRQALGIDAIPEERRIPAGYLQQSNGIVVPVSLDSGFLIGPEGAHLNVSGISGLATKTSYIMFLLQSVMQSSNANNTAVIIFNVKGDDLLSIDKAADQLETVEKDWQKCGLRPVSFDNVRYYFPYKNSSLKGYADSWCSPTRIAELSAKDMCNNFVYTYKEDKEKIDLLLSNIDDSNLTLDSIMSAIRTDQAFQDVADWVGLSNILEKRCQTGQPQGAAITVQSWRRFKRLLNTVLNTTDEGIFQDSLSGSKDKKHVHLSKEISNIRGGESVVVDIANLPEQHKCLVFGDVIRTVYKMKTEGSETCPDRIIIFVDELNKYAPSEIKSSPIIGDLIEITERGRSLGIVLFSAEQFRSAIHSRVKGNCATNVFGRTNSVEVATSDYKFIPKTYTGMMTRLSKGHLIIQHPIFRSLIKIAFPRPAYNQPNH